MRHLLLITMLLVCQICMADSNTLPDSLMAMLNQLDSEIDNSPKYNKDKRRRIDELTNALKNSSNLFDKYSVNEDLYAEYKVYNSDSALYYARENLRISKQRNDSDLEGLWRSRVAFVLINTGKMTEAEAMLKGVRAANLDDNTRIEYYEEMLHLHSYAVLYDVSSDKAYYRKLINAYRDSIAAVCTPSHPMYLWYKANRINDSPQRKQTITDLEATLSKEENNSRMYAMNAYALSRLYSQENNDGEEIKWLINSAIGDVKSVNREIASLAILSKMLYARGYSKYAYRFLSYCHQQALAYNNRVRLYSITKVEQDIFDKMLLDTERQHKTLRLFTVAMIVLAAALLALLFFFVRVNRNLHRSRQKLQEVNKHLSQQKNELAEQNEKVVQTNAQLETLNAQLKRLNEDLSDSMRQTRESDYVKEEYIGAVFQLCSTYIERMDSFRKTINRRLKTRMYDEACAMTDTPAEVQAVVKEFYASFDAIFLNIYPSFIDDFNALLKPDEQIVPKEGQLLNTELRIYALVCMGITDSLRISHILHCSPQTVYNNRNRLRNKAIISSHDFDDAVRQIGKSHSSQRG